MITHDGVPCELDEKVSCIQLVLPLPGAKNPRPHLLMHLRFTMQESVLERGDFIGQNAMMLLCPGKPVDMTHWEDLGAFTHTSQKDRFTAMLDQIILYPEPVAGKDTDMLNGTRFYEVKLRRTDGYGFLMEMEAAIFPRSIAAQLLFGFGDNPPTEEELQEMNEPLHIMEELPLWSVLVQTPAGLTDRTAWAQEQAKQRLGLTALSAAPHGLFRILHFPNPSSFEPDPPPVRLLTPWAQEDGA